MTKQADPSRVQTVKRLLSELRRTRDPDERVRLSTAVLTEVQHLDEPAAPAPRPPPEGRQ
jgi:hypothetical protein